MTTVVVVWPAKGSQLMDVCRDIIAMYNGNKVKAIGEQIFKTLQHLAMTDVTSMKPNYIQHYVMEEKLQAVFKNLDSETMLVLLYAQQRYIFFKRYHFVTLEQVIRYKFSTLCSRLFARLRRPISN